MFGVDVVIHRAFKVKRRCLIIYVFLGKSFESKEVKKKIILPMSTSKSKGQDFGSPY
jgi:hypothetical protein